MKPSEEIRETRNLLFEHGWTRGKGEADDGRLCILGAYQKARGKEGAHWSRVQWEPQNEAVRAIATAIGFDPDSYLGRIAPADAVWRFNDHYAESFDDIVDVLDKAEKIAETREATLS